MPNSAVHHVTAESFRPEDYANGEKHQIALDVGVEGCDPISVLLFRGAKPGKTLVLTAGVHGDEFEGVRTILELSSEFDPGGMNGSVLAVPVVNPPAFWKVTRTSPLDGLNLARSFPGRRTGKPSEVIACWIGEAIIARADFYLDLHSAGIEFIMPCMVGFDSHDMGAREAALVFGAPVVWGHPALAPGRSICLAAERGIPWLYSEARGGARIDKGDLAIYKRGVMNLLRHLAIIPGPIDAPPPERFLFGDGNLDASLRATRKGFFIPSVDLLDCVRKGEELGRTVNLYGELLERFCAPRDGAVAMMRAVPVVNPGNAVCVVTEVLE